MNFKKKVRESVTGVLNLDVPVGYHIVHKAWWVPCTVWWDAWQARAHITSRSPEDHTRSSIITKISVPTLWKSFWGVELRKSSHMASDIIICRSETKRCSFHNGLPIKYWLHCLRSKQLPWRLLLVPLQVNKREIRGPCNLVVKWTLVGAWQYTEPF